jgi:hypothetical protein
VDQETLSEKKKIVFPKDWAVDFGDFWFWFLF